MPAFAFLFTRVRLSPLLRVKSDCSFSKLHFSLVEQPGEKNDAHTKTLFWLILSKNVGGNNPLRYLFLTVYW